MSCSKFDAKSPCIRLADPCVPDYLEFSNLKSGLGHPYLREVKAVEYKELDKPAVFYLMIVFSTTNKKGQLMVCCVYNWRVNVPAGHNVRTSELRPDITTRFTDKSVLRLITCKRVIAELSFMSKTMVANPFSTNGHGWDSFDKLHGPSVNADDEPSGGRIENDVMGMAKTRLALHIALASPEALVDIALKNKFTRYETLHAINNKLSFEDFCKGNTPPGLSPEALDRHKAEQLALERAKIALLENKADFQLATVTHYMNIITHVREHDDPVFVKEMIGRGALLGEEGARTWDKLVFLVFLKSTADRLRKSPLNLGILMTTVGAYLAEYNDKDARFGVILPRKSQLCILMETEGIKFLLDDTAKRGSEQEKYIAELKANLDLVRESKDTAEMDSHIHMTVDHLTTGADIYGFQGHGLLGLVKRLFIELCIGRIVFPQRLHQRIAVLFAENGLEDWSLDLPEVHFDESMKEPYDLLMSVGLSQEEYNFHM